VSEKEGAGAVAGTETRNCKSKHLAASRTTTSTSTSPTFPFQLRHRELRNLRTSEICEPCCPALGEPLFGGEELAHVIRQQTELCRVSGVFNASLSLKAQTSQPPDRLSPLRSHDPMLLPPKPSRKPSPKLKPPQQPNPRQRRKQPRRSP